MNRFEHLEHRDGSVPGGRIIPLVKWYKNQRGWTMGPNYYVNTFVGEKENNPPVNRGDFYWTYHRYHNQPMTYSRFMKSIENLRRFHIILITEWLDTSGTLLQRVLNWKIPPRQVLPHEVQAVRKDKVSRPSIELLSREDYHYLITDNIFDLLFFQITKRIYLERLFCY